jgi:hypothetical protein
MARLITAPPSGVPPGVLGARGGALGRAGVKRDTCSPLKVKPPRQRPLLPAPSPRRCRRESPGHPRAPVNTCCFHPPPRAWGKAGGGAPYPHVSIQTVKRLPFPPPPLQPPRDNLCLGVRGHSCAPALLRGSPTPLAEIPLAGKRGARLEPQTCTEAGRGSGAVGRPSWPGQEISYGEGGWRCPSR